MVEQDVAAPNQLSVEVGLNATTKIYEHVADVMSNKAHVKYGHAIDIPSAGISIEAPTTTGGGTVDQIAGDAERVQATDPELYVEREVGREVRATSEELLHDQNDHDWLLTKIALRNRVVGAIAGFFLGQGAYEMALKLPEHRDVARPVASTIGAAAILLWTGLKHDKSRNRRQTDTIAADAERLGALKLVHNALEQQAPQAD